MFKDVSNVLRNFKFIGERVFKIAGVRPTLPPPSWYQVWVPKGLVQEGLNRSFLSPLLLTIAMATSVNTQI